MSLLNNAIDGLAGALVSAAVGAVAIWYTRHSRESRQEEAWQRRADELSELIAKQFSNEIAWLRRQLRGCQDECKRLNRIINRQINRGNGDHP